MESRFSGAFAPMARDLIKVNCGSSNPPFRPRDARFTSCQEGGNSQERSVTANRF